MPLENILDRGILEGMKNPPPKTAGKKKEAQEEVAGGTKASVEVVEEFEGGSRKLNEEETRGWLQTAFDAIKRNPDVIVSLALMLVPSGQLPALASKVPGAGRLLGLVAKPAVAAKVKPAAAATQQLAKSLITAMKKNPQLVVLFIANMDKLPVPKKLVPARDVLKAVLGVAFKPKPKP